MGVQDVLVTLIATGAASVLLRRVFACVAPAKDESPCGSCSPSCAAKPAGAPPAAPSDVLHVVRPSREPQQPGTGQRRH